MNPLNFPLDEAACELIDHAQRQGIDTVWHRYQKQQPQCGFGSLGLCCRICWKGPCRIDPFGQGATEGICGAGADTIVARNFLRMIASGAASHSEHGRVIALVLKNLAGGRPSVYQISDQNKLNAVVKRLALMPATDNLNETLMKVATASLEDYQRQDADIELNWIQTILPKKRLEKLRALNLIPHNIDALIAKTLARTHIGCDADYMNLILGGLKASVADLNGMTLATELSDILFGTPMPVRSRANLGALDKNAVNIALNGHNPLLSEIICQVADRFDTEAKAVGATAGINIVGICCTGNEVLMRRGIPLVSNYLSQELPVLTGVVEAMILDVQCIMPSLVTISECFHTRVITTAENNKIPGATHIEFTEENAEAAAAKIIKLAINAFRQRDPEKIHLPSVQTEVVAGFSAEAVLEALKAVNPEDPAQVLIEALMRGDIAGIVLFAGCNHPGVSQDSRYVTMAQAFAQKNVLMLATGCGAGALAKHGMMTAKARDQFAGSGLKAVLETVGKAAGIEDGLPLVLHMGSCVDNSRAMMLGKLLADRLNVDLSDLPLVASAPEVMSEKGVVIGTWAVTAGLVTHLGTTPQILGSDNVRKLVTEECQSLIDGYFLVEPDPIKAVHKLYEVIMAKRQQLGLN